MESKNLPRFGDPPVIETVLGVEFAPIEGWSIPHFGLFWDTVRSDFPKSKVLPPLDSQIERFDAPVVPQGLSISMLESPDVRCWFIAPDDRTLLQVQRNRFVFNWKKEGATDTYPHYDSAIRPSFEKYWARYLAFMTSAELPVPEVLQCEVSYINHLEIQKGWSSPAELSKVFPLLAERKWQSFLPEPEALAFEARFRLPNNRGRLRISSRPAIRSADGKEIIQLTLTVRGKPDGPSTDQVLEWLDFGRDWVVRGFADFTTKRMHDIWKRTN